MSETASPQNVTVNAPANTDHNGGTGQPALRCQWCSVPLEAGVTVCPTCGSPGIPDPRMTVTGLTSLDSSDPEPLPAATVATAIDTGQEELVEWWRDESDPDDPAAERRETLSYDEVERRRMQTLGFIGGALVICALLGWLIGPSLLEGPFEGLTGTTVEDPSDLRGMGTIGGIITGMFIGATGGWVIWSNN